MRAELERAALASLTGKLITARDLTIGMPVRAEFDGLVFDGVVQKLDYEHDTMQMLMGNRFSRGFPISSTTFSRLSIEELANPNRAKP